MKLAALRLNSSSSDGSPMSAKPSCRHHKESFPHSCFPMKIHFQTEKYLEAKNTGGAAAGFLAISVLTPAHPCFAGCHPVPR